MYVVCFIILTIYCYQLVGTYFNLGHSKGSVSGNVNPQQQFLIKLNEKIHGKLCMNENCDIRNCLVCVFFECLCLYLSAQPL